MGYIHSDNIKVFPTTQRSNKDASARMMTEFNLTSIINRLVDMDSFIVTTHASNQEMDDSIEEYIFNINGYLFTVPNGVGAKNIIATTLNDYFINNDITELTKGTSYYLLAHIRKETYQGVNKDSDLMTYTQLSPTATTAPEDYENGILDADEKFNGLEFIIIPKSNISNYSSTATDKYLILFEYKQNARKWYEYEDSKVKFKTITSGSRRSVTIDDGELTQN